jgi:hypothetical protein
MLLMVECPDELLDTRWQLCVIVDDTGTVTWTTVLGQSRTVTPIRLPDRTTTRRSGRSGRGDR